MKAGIILFLLYFFPNTLFSQTKVDRCYFGTCIINFGVEPFQVVSADRTRSIESPASICDEQGNLLFYTNGGPSPTSNAVAGIWDASFQIMQNALPLDSAGCVSSYSGATIVPFPSIQKAGSLNYYIFTKDCVESSFSADNYNSGLSVSVVDMSLNNGLGAVISKHQTVVPFASMNGVSTNDEPLAVVSHSNDIDYWLYSYTNGFLYKLPVTTAGIGTPIELFPASEGRIVFSPSRNFAVLGNKLYEFNASTGNLIFTLAFPSSGQSAFSSDGTKIYRMEGTALAQYDATSSAILNSRINVANTTSSGQIFLAANSSIYICSNESSFIYGQIRCPNTSGLECQFQVINQSLNGGFTGSNSFINFPSNWLFKQTAGCDLSLSDNQLVQKMVRISYTESAFNIESDLSQHVNVKLFNSIGSVLFESDFQHSLLISSDGFRSGIYFLEVTSHDGKKEVHNLLIR